MTSHTVLKYHLFSHRGITERRRCWLGLALQHGVKKGLIDQKRNFATEIFCSVAFSWPAGSNRRQKWERATPAPRGKKFFFTVILNSGQEILGIWTLSPLFRRPTLGLNTEWMRLVQHGIESKHHTATSHTTLLCAPLRIQQEEWRE